MKIFFRSILALSLLLLALPAAVTAHGSIFTFKYIDGPNLIMVTHNVHDAQSGVPINYNLRLYNMDGQLVPFQNVRAEIKQGSNTVLNKTVPVSEHADTTLDYAYPSQGEYKLYLSFMDHDKQIAHGEFPIVVQKGVNQGFLSEFFTVQSAVTFLLGVGITMLYAARRRIKLPRRFHKN